MFLQCNRKRKKEEGKKRAACRHAEGLRRRPPAKSFFLENKKQQKKKRERDERGTRRCMLFLSSFLAPVFIIILFFPSSFHSDSLSCSTRSADFITARRAVFGEQPDIFIFFPVGKSMMAQIFTSLRLVFSIIFFPFFFLSFWAFPKKKDGRKQKQNTQEEPVIVFCFWAKSRLKLIQSAPERGHPSDGDGAPRLEKKNKRERFFLAKLFNSLSICIYIYVRLYKQRRTRLRGENIISKRWPARY